MKSSKKSNGCESNQQQSKKGAKLKLDGRIEWRSEETPTSERDVKNRETQRAVEPNDDVVESTRLELTQTFPPLLSVWDFQLNNCFIFK